VDVIKGKGFLGEFRLHAVALVFPGAHVAEVFVVALGFAFFGLTSSRK
jgi:hypothetical protein